jgi:hypothetical protein
MTYHCPFYDSYVLLNSKEESKVSCVIDRRFTKISYQVFSMILNDSTPENFEDKLKNPQEYIKQAQNIRRKRKVEYDSKKHSLNTNIKQNHVNDDHRTEGISLETETPKAIKASLKEAHEILFVADVEDMPLYSNAAWQFLVDLRYNFQRIGQAPAALVRSKVP